MNKRENIEIYKSSKSQYSKLGVNINQAIELILAKNGINYLSVSHRIKSQKSFIDKISRKGYINPLEQMEDFCALRIICYYKSDIPEIVKIISKEFDVIESQDKENLLNEDQFGYRSTHIIAKIRDDWKVVPNYRNLTNLKTEIQIRTVLMHAWAEIEHKLSYKNEDDIPQPFKRKLYILSAKLEEAICNLKKLEMVH